MTNTELLPTINTAFSLELPTLQLAWDSVSIGAFKTCPRYYKYTIVDGWQPKRKSVHLDFGIWFHSARERFYHAKAEGKSHDEAVCVAVHYVLKVTWNPVLRKPWISDDPNKNRYTLVRTVVWYLDHWKDDPLETVILANGKPAVELSFRFQTDFDSGTTGEPFWLSGHLDRIAKMNDLVYLSDLKSTKHTLDQNYFSQFSPDNQMSLYPFAAKVVFDQPVQGMIVDAAQIAVSFSRFSRGPVLRSDAQLEEWYKDFGFLLQSADTYALANYWPMNDKACFRCDFRDICSKSPQAREIWLKAGFVKRIWDPLVSRGDV